MNHRMWRLALSVALGASVVSAFGQQKEDSLSDVIVGKLGIPLYVPGEVLVKFQESALPRERGLAVATVRGAVAEHILTGPMQARNESGILLLRVPGGVDDAIRALQADPAVEYAEPNWIYQHTDVSNDTYYTNGSLWGMYGDASPLKTNQYGSQAGEAWNAGHTGSNGVYVGIIDEGVMYSHSDLGANSWSNPFDPVDGVDNDGNGYVDDARGWDFDGNNNSTFDGSQDDHGTHVAGTIGAVGGNGIGVAGVNWSVSMISCKFLGRRGGTTANAVKAVDYITDLKTRHGLNIVATNNSWGGGGFSSSLQGAITRAGNANILFIAAAGNSGVNIDASPSYPASYNNSTLIAVASITSTGGLSSFSNYGATSVDIGAPGSGIYSTLPTKQNGSTYGSYSGTSMACPHVTGGAALYASTHAGASAAATKNAILGSAVATSSLAGKCATGGRLNVSGF
jgi:subtilisin family serine protease